MTTSKAVSRTSACFTWLSVVALAGSTLGCSPAHDDGPDGAEPGGPGGYGGSTSHVDGGGAGERDAGGGGGAGVAGGSGGAPATGCTNTCTTGATRCASGTTLEICGVGANGCTSFVATPCTGGAVCERTAPADCVEPEWAEWPMPSAPAEVAKAAPNLQTLVDNQDGTVTDKVTGLMWEQAYHPTMIGQLGPDFCATQVAAGGHTDWRMPTIIELVSIADFTRDKPSIDTTIFPLADNAGPFWSSTPREGFNSLDIIDYYFGFIGSSAGFDIDAPGQNVRCVR